MDAVAGLATVRWRLDVEDADERAEGGRLAGAELEVWRRLEAP